MGGSFPKPSPPPPTTIPVTSPPPPELSPHDKAVLQLKQTRDKLIKYQQKNNTESAQLVIKVKSLLKEKKTEQAKLVLRLKKFKEKQVANIEAQLVSMQELLMSIESAEITVNVVNGLKAGNEALKKLNAMMPIEQVEAILEESREQQVKLDEIQNVLASGLDPSAEAEAMEELAMMEKQMVSLPDVPTSKPKVVGEEEGTTSEPRVTRKEAILA